MLWFSWAFLVLAGTNSGNKLFNTESENTLL